MCINDSVKCSPKNLVYIAECKSCVSEGKREILYDMNGLKIGERKYLYVGESSRPLRMRAAEHYDSLNSLCRDSFMLSHWMLVHSTTMEPPEFAFKVFSKYKDSLSRQILEAILIEDRGNLNKKFEFGINHISRLEAGMTQWDKNKLEEREANDRANFQSNLLNFIDVIKSVKIKSSPQNNLSNSPCTYRRKREEEYLDQLWQRGTGRKKIKMESSTPQWRKQPTELLDEDLSPIPSMGMKGEISPSGPSLESSVNDTPQDTTSKEANSFNRVQEEQQGFRRY